MSLKQHGSLCRWICSLQWTFISFSHIEGITNDDLRGTLHLHSPRSPVSNNVPVLWHFRKSKLNRTQLNRTRLQVKTHAKNDHGKTRGAMNVTPRTDASKFKSGGTFALIVLKSCGHFKVGEKYHNLAWVENKHVWNSSGARFARWLFFLFASRPFCPSITLSCKVNKKIRNKVLRYKVKDVLDTIRIFCEASGRCNHNCRSVRFVYQMRWISPLTRWLL